MATKITTSRLSTEIIEDLEEVRDLYLSDNKNASTIVGEAQDKIDKLTDEVLELRGIISGVAAIGHPRG